MWFDSYVFVHIGEAFETEQSQANYQAAWPGPVEGIQEGK